ncbi:hypothetical protein B0T24DRAFT_270927 [Lasiosphaeria ovina]|uniref:Uncharacterized protein n=1 Tax=Lasiosphaeria ovina TaxID=92902 RepID=A0AAE0N7G6_9PEZI|nr:hypothetical protein B0T24DRAFT_270927 [Lasiosphaeria ovina]
MPGNSSTWPPSKVKVARPTWRGRFASPFSACLLNVVSLAGTLVGSIALLARHYPFSRQFYTPGLSIYPCQRFAREGETAARKTVWLSCSMLLGTRLRQRSQDYCRYTLRPLSGTRYPRSSRAAAIDCCGCPVQTLSLYSDAASTFLRVDLGPPPLLILPLFLPKGRVLEDGLITPTGIPPNPHSSPTQSTPGVFVEV